MSGKAAANDAVARHLLDAIERVRDDVEKVEFWAGAVAGFARPVPDYEPNEASVWLPTERASTLRSRMEPGDRGASKKGDAARNKNSSTARKKARPRN